MNSNSDNRWVWFLMRRFIVHLWLGATIGMIWGAICICFAGVIVGAVAGYLNGSIGLSIPGAMLGVVFGAIIGGIIGLIAGGAIGIFAPASRSVLPDGSVIGSTAAGMAIGTGLGVCLYFIGCFLAGTAGNGFAEATMVFTIAALYGVPVFMGIGQIYGIIRGTANLGKENASPDYTEIES
jgi:hypothetical protein